MFRTFIKNKAGNVGITFALAVVPLVMAAGATVDYGAASAQHDRAQQALDRAALAAGKDLGLVSHTVIETNLRRYFADFYKPPSGTTASVTEITIDDASGKVSAAGDVTTKTSFIAIASIPELVSSLASEVVVGSADLDVVMVLDTTGSMQGSKLSTLQSAAKDLVDVLLGMNTKTSVTDRVQVGIVPFAAAVNVGPQFGPTYAGTTRTSKGTGSGWLDVNTQSPIHTENWSSGLSDNRFDLFAALAAANPSKAAQLSWAGCVESRPYPHSVHDTPVTNGDPKSWFVPMFAPDEANYYSYWWNYSSQYFDNTYLSDNGSQCSGNVSYSTVGGIQAAQGRTCKYKQNTRLYGSTFDGGFGPNYSCTSKPILAMTRDKSTLYNTINSLVAAGNTNIHEGVMWGWRALSPEAPFSEGRTGTKLRPVRRIMILMTDGENTYNTDTTFNASTYAAYGYVAKGRLGTTSNSSSTIKAKQDALTAEACSNAKSEGGVTLYTVGFTVTAPDTIQMLETCASGSSYFFKADNNAGLVAAFQAIGNQITQLRVAQ